MALFHSQSLCYVINFIIVFSGKCLYLSGLIPEPMNANDDAQLIDFGIGFTNIVGRTTRGSADLKK